MSRGERLDALRRSQLMSIIADIQHRSAHIHWPKGIAPQQADLFAHNDIVIATPTGKIWGYLPHATPWPDWVLQRQRRHGQLPIGLFDAGVTFD
jgi:hypothetical protein